VLHLYDEAGVVAMTLIATPIGGDSGRLLPKHAARLLPGLDHSPPPLWTHCLVRWVAVVYAAEGKQIRSRFWAGRLTRRRRNLTAWRKSPPCQAYRTKRGLPAQSMADFAERHSLSI
jgi:hypothetical protein